MTGGSSRWYDSIMNTPLLAGLFGAWAAVEVAVGTFFLQAYAARRRDAEYFVFGLLCFAIAVTDCGLAGAAAVHGVSQWITASIVTHVGAFASTALNVHFAFQYVAPTRVRRVLPAVYTLAAFYVVLMVTGHWWEPGTVHVAKLHLFGLETSRAFARPTAVAVSGYALVIGEGLMTMFVLARAFYDGRREVRGALLGHVVIVLCAVNDILSVSGIVGTPYLVPYAFLVYGFGVADTLLVRYRRAAQELETTANELRQATAELTDSYLELSVVQEELFRKRQLASVGELAASIAHEVRNPLAVIKNAAATLKRHSLVAEDRNKLFEIVEEEVTRLNNLVTELLRFARPMNVRREEVPLHEIFRLLETGLPESYALEAKLTSEPNVQTVWADAGLLRLALQNILANACQAMPDGGKIVISAAPDVTPDAPGVRITVSDHGVGMDPKTLRRAVDPFFSTRPSGTGLGLPIADRIIQAHGGRVEVVSQPGEGTTVHLCIPNRRAEQRSHGEVRPSEPRA